MEDSLEYGKTAVLWEQYYKRVEPLIGTYLYFVSY